MPARGKKPMELFLAYSFRLAQNRVEQAGGPPLAYLGVKLDFITSYQAVAHCEETPGCVASKVDGVSEATEGSQNLLC